MMNDFMVAALHAESIFTDVSLALFQDSGWYTVNYAGANPVSSLARAATSSTTSVWSVECRSCLTSVPTQQAMAAATTALGEPTAT